jgi:N-acetylglutamate synthase-like GNAT family acetyltransferase
MAAGPLHGPRGHLPRTPPLALAKIDAMPVAPILIRRFEPQDASAVARLIVGIQREEFGIDITLEDQPDLADIPDFYQTLAGDFWVAEQNGGVVGSIGLKDIGERTGALSKMFVAGSARGGGASGRLLAALVNHARSRGLAVIYLGTTDRFLAAHRFYEKNGFMEVPAASLPDRFPRMAVDTRFYRLDLI